MKGLWKYYLAKRTAISTIAPLVAASRTRLGTIPEHTWRKPYFIGFIGTLISYFAMNSPYQKPNDEYLGLTQIKAWVAITGIPDDTIGEEMCVLSASADDDFMDGCRNANHFVTAYTSSTLSSSVQINGLDIEDLTANHERITLTRQEQRLFGNGGALAATLWEHFFDHKIP